MRTVMWFCLFAPEHSGCIGEDGFELVGDHRGGSSKSMRHEYY